MQMNDQMMTGTTSSSNGQRPTLLTVLCILTFISAGLSILANLLMLIGLGAFIEHLGMFGAAGAALLIPSLILSAGRGFGAIWMWQLKKNGFFIYAAVTAIEILFFPIFNSVVLGIGFSFNWFGFLVSAIFVGLYYTNLKIMK